MPWPQPPEQPLPPWEPQDAAQQPHMQAQLPYQAFYAPAQFVLQVQSTDGLCVAGMVLGIVGLVLFLAFYISIPCGILAIIFGALGIKRVQAEPTARKGSGMGVAGLVTGILAVIGGLTMLILLIAGAYSW